MAINRLEASDGTVLENPNQQQLESAISELGTRFDHLNFEYANSWLGLYGSAPNDIYLCYRETDVEYTSSALTSAEIVQVCLAAARGDNAWRSRIRFTPGTDSQTPVADATGTDSSKIRPQSWQDGFGASARSAVQREVSRGAVSFVSRAVRSILRKLG